MPLAVEQFDLEAYDVVISSSYAVAKGVITRPDQLHICYLHTPIRYAWDLQFQYLRETGLAHSPMGIPARMVLHYMRLWDLASAYRVNAFIANSSHTAMRAQKIYHRPAHVIYPPVDISAFTPYEKKEDYFLTVSRLVPYKKIDLIVDAFTQMPDKKLIVIGAGPEKDKLCSRAGQNVVIMGYQTQRVVIDHMQRARAFVFAALEDFGIVPVEAQACGTPVIAYGKGGARESVIEGKTGLFFRKQTVDSLKAAIQEFERNQAHFDVSALRKNAERFSKERFQREIQAYVEHKWAEFNKTHRTGKALVDL
jgi:glycosyltransferase involved in cell wall biosynthesis